MIGGGIAVPGVDDGAGDATALESLVQRSPSIVGPRPTFSITADARIAAKDSAFTIPTVSAFDGTETTKKSAELQNSPSLFKTNERSTRDDVGTGLRLAT